MSQVEKDNLGIEDEIGDSRFSINRILMEDNTQVVTLEEITQETKKDPNLEVVMKDFWKGELSDGVKQTLYGKIFEELSVNNGMLLEEE